MLIDFKDLFPRHNIKPKGVLHIGSSSGQETEHYVKQGIFDVVYIEALPNVFKELVEHVKDYKGRYTCINACITEKDGDEVIFNVANNGGQSSSILEFGSHSKQHPTVKFTDKLKLETSRIDTLFKTYNIDPDKYDFLNVDLQGSDLFAIKSMGELLHGFKWAYIEVNRDHVYKNCPLVGEVDGYMAKFGFKGVEEKWVGNWGDKLYII